MSVAMALNSEMEKDPQAAEEVIAMKADIADQARDAELHQAQRLVAEEPNRLETYALEIDVIEKLRRIYYFAKRIAKAAMPVEVEDKSD